MEMCKLKVINPMGDLGEAHLGALALHRKRNGVKSSNKGQTLWKGKIFIWGTPYLVSFVCTRLA